MYIVHGASWWLQMYRIMPSSASDHQQRNLWKYVPVGSVQFRGMTLNWFQQKMETRHPVEIYFGREFPAICYHCGVLAASSRQKLKNFREISAFFRITTPYDKTFKFLFWRFASRHRSTLLCAKLVKIVRREIGEIVRCLPDQKITKFRLLLKLSPRAQSLP